MLKNFKILFVCFILMVGLIGCQNETTEPADTGTETTETAEGNVETLEGIGEGFGGELKVEVTRDGDTITDVVVTENNETPDYATEALEEIPNRIVEANSTDVEMISGATRTSEAIIYAVNNALDPEAYPVPVAEEETEDEAEAISASDLYQGFGISNMGRKGPGTDAEEVQVWSINQVLADVLFDGEGKIVSILVDQIEVATPNYDGDGMPHFSGWPGQGGYNYDENHDGTIVGMTEDTEENLTAEIESWETKRQRGDAYQMGAGSWSDQMEAFEELFVGMTVEEVEEWFNTYTSDSNGRPLQEGLEDEADAAKWDALSDEDKAMLADVTASATMSLNDSHGNIVEAIQKAFDNKKPIEIESAQAQGLGVSNLERKGPGADVEEVQVWSLNQVFANTLFDSEGRIVSLFVDQLEVATPNYDGDGMPHFSGWPGQGGYNYDENHDGTITGMTEDTEENFFAEIEGWETKRDRGDAYQMGAGSWSDQMDAFEELFVGMTVEEVEEWFDTYTASNGRPLQEGLEDADDAAKWDALSDEDKTMLADVTASATMSLNDSHGNIVEAIRNSYENSRTIDITVE